MKNAITDITVSIIQMELYPGCGFYLPSTIYNLILLTHGPKIKNWHAFVKDVLIEVYGDKLINYTAKGTRGGPSINRNLLKGLLSKSYHKKLKCKFFGTHVSIKFSVKINDSRSRKNVIAEQQFVKYINHTIGNIRFYQTTKNRTKTTVTKKKAVRKEVLEDGATSGKKTSQDEDREKEAEDESEEEEKRASE